MSIDNPNFSSSREFQATPKVPREIEIVQTYQLPSCIKEEEIKDAIETAGDYLGDNGPHTVEILSQIPDRPLDAGIAQFKEGTGHILISVWNVNRMSNRSQIDGFYQPGNLTEQFWVTAFEEAFHIGRLRLGLFDPNYYSLPKNYTAEEYQRYATQIEEMLVDRALNGGILQRKFGPSAIRIGKRVTHCLFNNYSEGIIENDFKIPIGKNGIVLPNFSSKSIISPINTNRFDGLNYITNFMDKPERNIFTNYQIKDNIGEK